ncbi:MAG: PKD domain-containing protein [Planctomycetes bacterium]|nr:PKD domain-containing protein [Planctomycetota bacterium]
MFVSRGAILLVIFVGIATQTWAEEPQDKSASTGRIGFAEIIGQVQDWQQSDLIKTPWNLNRDKGGYGKHFRGFDRRRNFTFKIKADKDADLHTLEVKDEDRKPFAIRAGKTYTIVNRPVTTWNYFQCSFSVSELDVDWGKRPTIRLIVSAEANYSTFRPNKDEHPTAVCAYLIQVRPEGKDADLPPEHWPVWYINNWIHFAHTVLPTVHHRYMANHGFIYWSWGVFDPPKTIKGKPSIGVYRLLSHPETKKVSGVVLHTPGACELTGAKDERPRYSKPPIAKATASRVSGKAPLTVDFTASATDPDNDRILWYSWDFKGTDGIQFDATGAKVSHTFDQPGKYVVSLTVMDATGQPGVAHVRINVGKK